MGMNGPYNYRAGPNTLGIGVENQALIRPYYPPVDSSYGAKYNVKRSFNMFEGAGQFPIVKSGPTVDIKANGVYLSGQMELSALADFNKSLEGQK